jgi:hypothetical protein
MELSPRPAQFVIVRGHGLAEPLGQGDVIATSGDYEGNLYGAANMVTYADRVDQAAARLVESAPRSGRRRCCCRRR